MNFNFIPTDNLYKFMAISGLFLFVFNYYYSREQIYMLQEEAIKLERRQKFVMAEYTELNSILAAGVKSGKEISTALDAARNNRIQLADSLIHALEALIKKESKSNRARIQTLDAKIASAEKEISRLEKKYADWSKKTLSLGGDDSNRNRIDSLVELANFEGKLLALKTSKYENYERALVIGSIVSVFLIAVGFSKWIELQLMADRQIKREIFKKLNYLPAQGNRASLIRFLKKVKSKPRNGPPSDPKSRLY